MKLHETKVELKEVKIEVLTGIGCDECKCEIYPSETYFEVITGHHRWGRDSDESVSELELCSLKCLSENMTKYYNNEDARDTSFYEVIQRTFSKI